MKIELNEHRNSVKVTGNHGGSIEDQSVTSVLLFQILIELRTLNNANQAADARAEIRVLEKI